jgi:hypothetical protein
MGPEGVRWTPSIGLSRLAIRRREAVRVLVGHPRGGPERSRSAAEAASGCFTAAGSARYSEHEKVDLGHRGRL